MYAGVGSDSAAARGGTRDAALPMPSDVMPLPVGGLEAGLGLGLRFLIPPPEPATSSGHVPCCLKNWMAAWAAAWRAAFLEGCREVREPKGVVGWESRVRRAEKRVPLR